MVYERYLTKFPVVVKEQKHERVNSINGNKKQFKSTPSRQFASHFGFFSIDKGNNVDFVITLKDLRNKKNYYLVIAKQHIYDSLLTFLQYRPIRRAASRTEQLYCKSERLHKLMDHNGDMYNSSITNAKEQFDNAKKELGDIIVDSPNPISKRTAELQLDRLLGMQWKMELLSMINESKKTIKEIKISDIEKYEKKTLDNIKC